MNPYEAKPNRPNTFALTTEAVVALLLMMALALVAALIAVFNLAFAAKHKFEYLLLFTWITFMALFLIADSISVHFRRSVREGSLYTKEYCEKNIGRLLDEAAELHAGWWMRRKLRYYLKQYPKEYKNSPVYLEWVNRIR